MTTSNPHPEPTPEAHEDDVDVAGTPSAPDATLVRLLTDPTAASPAALAVYRSNGDPARVAARLSAAAAAGQQRLYPVVIGNHEWEALQEALPDQGWLEALPPAPGRLKQLSRLRQPRQRRRWLLRAIRSHRAVLDFAQRSEQLPPWLSLQLCATVVDDALALLFATQQQIYTADHDAAATFERLFVQPGLFVAEDLAVSLELHGLVAQARLLAGLAPDVQLDWAAALRRAHGLLDRFKRYVRARYTTAEERQQRRRLALVAAGALGAAALAGVVVWFIATRPEAALDATAQRRTISAPGGIVGVYFNGRRFQRRVLSRSDNTIALSLPHGRSPAPGVDHDNFSARWKGYLFFDRAGTHQLCTECDDGARLWFNGRELIDDWKIHGTNRTCVAVNVERGWYPIRLEYFEVSRGAVMRLLRGADDKHLQVVPAAHLCCRDEGLAKVPPPTKVPPTKVPPTKVPPTKVPPPVKAQPPAAKTTPAAKTQLLHVAPLLLKTRPTK